jgi:hypothetical protein
MNKILNLLASIFAVISALGLFAFFGIFVYTSARFFIYLIVYQAIDFLSFVGLLGFLVLITITKIFKDITDDYA